MFPTRAVFSKASRLPLTAKQGNKDYYKGNRAAYLPGGHRTGAPGKHVIGGKSRYRLVDEKVRYFVAPPISEIVNSLLKPYVHVKAKLTPEQKLELYGLLPRGGFDGEHYRKLSLGHENPTPGAGAPIFTEPTSDSTPSQADAEPAKAPST